MSESESVEPSQPTAGKFVRFCQWIAFLAVLLVVVLLTGGSSMGIKAPGSPIVAFGIASALGLLLLLAHAPPVFFRLSKPLKNAVYLAIPLYIVFGMYVNSESYTAYKRTPEGKAMVEQQAADEARRVKEEMEERQRQDTDAAARKREREEAERDKALAACFSVFGNRIDSLEAAVKDSLHNPDSFEHVETSAIVPDLEGNNVMMEFRGENGFGGIRTATIRAKIDPSDCSTSSIGTAEVM